MSRQASSVARASQLSLGDRVASKASVRTRGTRQSKRIESVISHIVTVLADDDENAPTREAKIKAFLFKWHLPIFFIVVLLVGYVLPQPGDFFNDVDMGGICLTKEACVYDSFSNMCVAFIFINSGMRLKTDEVKKAFKEWKAVLYGVFAILLLTPLITFWTITWNFSKPEFAIGFSLFFAQATSLSSGPTISAQANGNVALALLLTVITNLLGVATMPLFVTNFLNSVDPSDVGLNTTGDQATDVSVDTLPIIAQLIFLILLPLMIGKLMRYSERVVKFTVDHKVGMKLASSTFLAMIIWFSISNSQEDLKTVNIGELFLLFLPALGIHILILIVNYGAVRVLFNLRQAEKRSVVIMTSCKSLPVAITVLTLLEDEPILGSAGLVAIPMIVCHFVQVVFDAFLAASWAARPLEDDLDEAENGTSELDKVNSKVPSTVLNPTFREEDLQLTDTL